MMNKIAIVTLMFVVPMLKECLAQTSSDKTNIESRVEMLRKAMVDADQRALDDITSPQLSYGHSSGKVDTKESFIDGLVSGSSDFTDITLSDQTVDVIGDVALVRHKLSGHTQDKGKDPGTVNIGVLLVWYKDKKDWKLVGRQAFKL